MQTYIVIVSGSILIVSTVHLNGIWHLIWRYLLKPVLGGHPVLIGHYSIPRGCPLNTGFTVLIFFTAVSREELDSVGSTRLLLMPKCCLFQWIFFLWRVDYALEENVLTEQMWFLPLISHWEVVTRILIFCGYCLWLAWFALWFKSISFLTSFEK